MTNKEIAKEFQTLAKVMEYQGENTFKIRSYDKAYNTLRKLDEDLTNKSEKDLQEIEGIGKAISLKIREVIDTGKLPLLERYKTELPDVVLQLLGVRGLGVKKVKQLVTELKIESVGELLYAAQENRVAELKGFSQKTQETLKSQLEFHQRSLGKARYAELRPLVSALIEKLETTGATVSTTGTFRRQIPTIEFLELVATNEAKHMLADLGFNDVTGTGSQFSGQFEDFNVRIHLCSEKDFGATLLKTTGSAEFLEKHRSLITAEGATEEDLFANAGIDFVLPAQRELSNKLYTPRSEILLPTHIRGVVHAHSTYSDGATSVEVLAKACKKAGYEYLTMTDHSKVATYANGVSVERLREQCLEIEELNKKLKDFHIFKGTECDIMRDGSLDYDNATLDMLDIVIASVHSVLRMSKADATERLLTAIANPYTMMLGHPTGRILLSREGYPLDMEVILDACAKHKVAIEVNASPYRLDLDWTFVRAAVDRGILISINPDAHSLGDIANIEFGVLAAQKAGLRQSECLNACDTAGFMAWVDTQKAKRQTA